MKRIAGPVGPWDDEKVRNRKGNRPADIKTVQHLLANAAKKKDNPAFSPGSLDGKIARPPRSSSTLRALRAFQSDVLEPHLANGRLEMDDTTWKELVALDDNNQEERKQNPRIAVGRADFYYIGVLNSSGQRTDGRFYIPSRHFSCAACSGSGVYYPIPDGEYKCTNFRRRSKPKMIRDDVGFSVDLSDKYDPVLKRMRTSLRIHPDGGPAGTAGCVGILEDFEKCRDLLKEMLPKNTPRVLWAATAIRADQIPSQPWGIAREFEEFAYA